VNLLYKIKKLPDGFNHSTDRPSNTKGRQKSADHQSNVAHESNPAMIPAANDSTKPSATAIS